MVIIDDDRTNILIYVFRVDFVSGNKFNRDIYMKNKYECHDKSDFFHTNVATMELCKVKRI
jgi:hypothetical protein